MLRCPKHHSRNISIHALREEGDPDLCAVPKRQEHFYPRPPRGGRRDVGCNQCSVYFISIHALREEGDHFNQIPQTFISHFYPRPPRGGRPRPGVVANSIKLFLSTPSARRATQASRAALSPALISIHALREEGDYAEKRRTGSVLDFYPRPPRGGRPGKP